MFVKTLATAAYLSLATATASFAAPVNFNFSFTDGANTVTGLIEGLNSNGFGQQATKVTATGLGETVEFTTFRFNNFDVTNSMIDLATLDLFSGNFDPRISLCGTNISSEFCLPALFTDSDGGRIASSEQASFSVAVSPVPLPAGGLLLLSGLAGFFGLRRRKNRAA